MKALIFPPTSEPIFAALIRTTGARNLLLEQALQSISFQSLPCLAIVIVHGSAEAFSQVQQLCAGMASTHVLHAPNSDPTRRRGYPLNLGIDYSLTHFPHVQFLFLLDDDDAVYPFFTQVMASAFETSQADLVYAASNRRESGQPLAPAFPNKPYHHLLNQNFIPSNAYSVRVAALRQSGVQFAEDLDSLEDWLFLLNLLEKGLRFHSIDMTLSEFRTESDADFAYRNNLTAWRANAQRIRRYINATSFALPGAYLAQLPESATTQAASETPDRFSDSSITAALHRRVWELEHSLSWKLSAPLRAIAAALLRLRSHMKART